jgi:hypothetical protein
LASVVFAHPDPAAYYVLYGAAAVLILLTGGMVLVAGRILVGVIRPSQARQPPTSLGGRAMETLEVALWSIAGIIVWYWLAATAIGSLGLH